MRAEDSAEGSLAGPATSTAVCAEVAAAERARSRADEARAGAVEAPRLEPAEFRARILFQNDRVLAVDKPPWLPVHPAKAGPGSSLASAACRHLATERIHPVSRLDRETSGIVVFALDRGAARILQGAVERREVRKGYLALLHGTLGEALERHDRIVPDRKSAVRVKMRAASEKDPAGGFTCFEPLLTADRKTLCRVRTAGGRKHQIRVHAAAAGLPLVGDKLYGPDETLYLEFCREGWTPRLRDALGWPRQMLHAEEWSVENPLGLPPLHQPPPPAWTDCLRDPHFRLDAAEPD
jgi:23S rRNA-/tRNA-specific pseudouridylate synthase